MEIVLIGAGNVAYHLSKFFSLSGHKVKQVWSRNIDHAIQTANCVGAEGVCHIEEIDCDADCYVIAVPDDHIGEMSAQLPQVKGVVLHTSGSIGLTTLVQKRCGVVWFPHSFVEGKEMDYGMMNCCYECSTDDVEATMLELLRGVHTYRLDSEQRRWAHLASVFANNFGHAMNCLAERIATEHGIDFSLLYPLIRSTAESAMQPDLSDRQTGPAARNDTKTLAAHQAMLSTIPEALEVYSTMTRLIQSSKKPSGNW